jgi:restriction endonuclease S subunit
MRDIDYRARCITGDLYQITIDKLKEEQLLSAGDVVFVSMGVNNVAICLDDLNEKTIAAPTLFVLRPTSDRLLSAYLARYINSRSVQQQLRESSRGTTIPIVTKRMLERMELPIPPIDQQRAIVELDRLAATERRIITSLQDKRDRLIESYLHNPLI